MKESLEERIDNFLFELDQREVRKYALQQVKQLAENLVKIAVFGIRSGWVKEFKTKILDIQETKSNTKKKFLNSDEYFDLLYLSYFHKTVKWNKTPLYKMIERFLDSDDYKKLQTPLRDKITESDIQLILYKTEQLMKPICKLLSEDEVTNKILEEVMKEYVRFWEKERGIVRQ